MPVKNDRWIRKMATEQEMIRPFEEKQVREGVISYGLSSYGYDLRVADEFKKRHLPRHNRWLVRGRPCHDRRAGSRRAEATATDYGKMLWHRHEGRQ